MKTARVIMCPIPPFCGILLPGKAHQVTSRLLTAFIIVMLLNIILLLLPIIFESKKPPETAEGHNYPPDTETSSSEISSSFTLPIRSPIRQRVTVFSCSSVSSPPREVMSVLWSKLILSSLFVGKIGARANGRVKEDEISEEEVSVSGG